MTRSAEYAVVQLNRLQLLILRKAHFPLDSSEHSALLEVSLMNFPHSDIIPVSEPCLDFVNGVACLSIVVNTMVIG